MLDNDIQVQTPEQVRLKLHLAGIGSRAVAQLIDLLILAVFYALFTISEVMWQWLNVFGRATSYLVGAAVVISFLIFWGYFIALETALSGQTIGKRIMKIRAMQRDGRPISFYGASVRNLLRLVDFLPFGYLIGLIAAVIDTEERRIGDLAAGTVVVQDRVKRGFEYLRRLAEEDRATFTNGEHDFTNDFSDRFTDNSPHLDKNREEDTNPDRQDRPFAGSTGDSQAATTQREVFVVSAPKVPVSLAISQPLSGEWQQFLMELAPRLKGLSKARRLELIPEVWRNLTALEQVSVQSVSKGTGAANQPSRFSASHKGETPLSKTDAAFVNVTDKEMEQLLMAIGKQLRGTRRGRKSR